MLGATKESWPLSGEIDIMEMGHGSAMNVNGANLVNSYPTGYLHWNPDRWPATKRIAGADWLFCKLIDLTERS